MTRQRLAETERDIRQRQLEGDRTARDRERDETEKGSR